MNFRKWLNERTLYHGTVIDNEPTIRKYGLHGGWHEPENTWVGDAYGGDYEAAGVDRTEDDDVIFMTDKEQLDKSLGAMVFHIGKKLNKDYHDVTDTDIRNHGLLVIMKDMDLEPYDPDSDLYYAPPMGAETGDYFSPSEQGDLFLRGPAMLRYLKRHGAWPRDWGER